MPLYDSKMILINPILYRAHCMMGYEGFVRIAESHALMWCVFSDNVSSAQKMQSL